MRLSNQSFSVLFPSADIVLDSQSVTFWLSITNAQRLSRSSNGDSGDGNGDNVLVDGDLDEDKDDVEQSPTRNDDEYLLWIKRAVNTSSSFSISESELLDAEAAGDGSNLIPAARKFCSSSSSWPMKFKFGEMIGRASFTIL